MKSEDNKDRRVVALLIGGGMLIIITFLSYVAVNKIQENGEVQKKLSSFNPPPIFKLDSTKFEFDPTKSLMLVVFNSTCEICKVETLDIKTNLSLLSNYQIIMISSEPIDVIRDFQLRLSLDSEANVFFSKINEGDVFATFGMVSFPHILIYSNERKLIKQFKGAVDIKSMIKKIGIDVSRKK